MFKLEIKTEDSDFHDDNGFDPGPELVRIFHKLSHCVCSGQTEGVIMSTNGSRVGTWELTS